MSEQLDLIIIGAGPGGYVAAIRASQLGMKTMVVEKYRPGGVCLNWGCIPSKNLIHQAELFHSMKEMEAVGVKVDRSKLDYAQVQANSRVVVKTLTNGVAGLLKRNRAELVEGVARITGKGEVTVTTKDDEKKKYHARNIMVATGSRPMDIPGFECDEETVLSSNGVLAMTQLPKSIVILGAGAIGCEFAYVLNCFGVKVALVEAADHLLPTEDFETCAVLDNCFKRDGIEVLTSTRAAGLKKNKKGVTVEVTQGDDTSNLQADKVLVVFGRVPNTENLGLKEMGVKMTERGYVEIGDYGKTQAPGIYAIGDITQSAALAHVASKEGEIAVEYMAGHEPDIKQIDDNLVPSAIYCEPQVAGFGLREDEALAKKIPVKKSVFQYQGAGKTIAVGKPEGLVKILVDPETDELLGAHIVGHNATELIHELLLAKQAELLPEDIAHMIHAHPTISEAVMEAARGINGKPIHA